MLKEMPIEHMPGYFVLLHFWLPLTGEHDFGIRFLSLWPSLLAVAIAYRLAVDMGNRQAGIWTSLLLATNGFQIWYAQEARMYSWLLAMSLLATWLLWRALRRDVWYLWLGYMLAVGANIYLHFYGFLMPLAHTVFMILWLMIQRQWRPFLRWIIAGLGVLVLFLPWLPRSLQIFQFPGWRSPADPSVIPWLYFVAYTVGDTMPTFWHDWLPMIYIILIIVGTIRWWHCSREAALLLVIAVIVPWSTVIALALRNPDFHERYAIAISGPLLLLSGGWLWGRGSSFYLRGRWLISSILLGGLLYFNYLGLEQLYNNSAFHKPDFRGAAQHIQQNEEPGDVLLIDGPDPELVFLHYYSGPNHVHDLRFLEKAETDQIHRYLAETTANSNQIWELLYFRHPGHVQVWNATQAWPTSATNHNDIRVTLYGLPYTPMQTYPLNINFGSALLLEQVELDTLTPSAGHLLHVTTHWHTIEQAPEYKFSLRLRKEATQELVLSHDYVPQNGFAPTYVWWVGHPAADQRGIILPDTLAPGAYVLTLRLYDPKSGTPVETVFGQDVLLAEIQIIES